MFGNARMPTPAELAQNALEKRAFVKQQIEEVKQSGSREDVRAWKAQLREWEKLIARYGLEEHAYRT